MKKTQIFFFLVIATITLSLTSCKDDDEPDPVPTKTEILSDRMWTIQKMDFYEEGELDESELGDGSKLHFKADHTGVSYDGDGELYETWTWEFNSGETRIIIEVDTEATTFDIDTLTDTSFVMSKSFVEDDVNYKYILTLNR